MKLDSTDEIIAYTREWAINKVESAELVGDKIASMQSLKIGLKLMTWTTLKLFL